MGLLCGLALAYAIPTDCPYNPVRQFPIGVNRVALNHLTPLLEMQPKVLIHGVGNANKLEKQGSYHS